MSNETVAAFIAAFYFLFDRKASLTLAILLYYCAYIVAGSYTVGLRYDAEPELFYAQQSLIDLAAIVFICYLSNFHQVAKPIYTIYAAIISFAMMCNAMMLLDQAFQVGKLHHMHLWYQSAAHYIDLTFAIVGSSHVAAYVVRILPFSGR